MEKLEIEIITRVLPVSLKNPKTGKTEEYELREMSSADRDKYLDKMRERAKLNSAGEIVGVARLEGMHADLITNCLFKTDGSNTKVTVKQVQDWPATVVSKLYKAAQGLNALDGAENVKDAAKKDSEAND